MYKVAIVEDDKKLLKLLSVLIESTSDFELAGTYYNGGLFLNVFKTLEVDVVIMDIQMPGKTGIECIKEAKAIKPNVQFIVSTAFDNQEYIFQSLCAGASGYLLKTEKPERICEAIIDVMNGGSPMTQSIARMVVGSFFKPTISTTAAELISEREKEIVQQLSNGLNYKEIGEKLFISPQTVRTHIRNIYEKLQVKSKMDAVNKVFKG
jgi:DNA-binding NarL/FixJ family response regulator